MKKIKYVLLIFMLIIGTVILTGCSQADRVNYNMDKSNICDMTRRIVVIEGVIL